MCSSGPRQWEMGLEKKRSRRKKGWRAGEKARRTPSLFISRGCSVWL
ncbi:hypothetical protein RSAG8_13391, partial [Rhizoctonia solani AG-8 WAC10335]